jgi:hypothetical protein
MISHYFNDKGPDGKPVGLLDAILSTFGDPDVDDVQAGVPAEIRAVCGQ